MRKDLTMIQENVQIENGNDRNRWNEIVVCSHRTIWPAKLLRRRRR